MAVMDLGDQAWSGGPVSAFRSCFSSLGRTVNTYKINSNGDMFSMGCLVLCALNLAMALRRVVQCNVGGSTPDQNALVPIQQMYALPDIHDQHDSNFWQLSG